MQVASASGRTKRIRLTLEEREAALAMAPHMAPDNVLQGGEAAVLAWWHKLKNSPNAKRIKEDALFARELAEKRGRSLLCRLLTEQQWDDFERLGTFFVETGGVLYQLGSGRVVVIGDNGAPLESWCVYPAAVPLTDVIIGQYLHLMHSPAKLRQQACVTSYRSPLRPGILARRILRQAGYEV